MELGDLYIYCDEDGYYVNTKDVVHKWMMRNSYSHEFKIRVKYMSILAFINNLVEPDENMLSFMFGDFDFNETMDIFYDAVSNKEMFDLIMTEIAKKYPDEYKDWVSENE